METPPGPSPAPLQCTTCGAAIAPSSKFCTGCGSNVPGALPWTAPLVASGPAADTGPQKFSIWIPVKLIVVALGALLVTMFAEHNAPTAEAVGYWMGATLLPLLIALAVVRFKPAKRMRTFSTVFCCVGLFGIFAAFSSTAVSRLSRAEPPEKSALEIVKEAAGTKPIDDSGNASDREVSRVLREFISDMLAARREHDAEMELLQPVLTNLYMAESFQDKKHMEGAMATVKETLRVDGEMADKIQRLPQEAKARVDASSLDQQTRDDFMRGVEKAWGSSEILSCYREVHSSEEQWGATTIDLFNFALQHAAAIKTKHRKIVIANPALLSQFNEKFNNSRNLRLKLHEANQRLAATQAAAMKKLGVTKSDLGLDKK